jgi:hypothetical protein
MLWDTTNDLSNSMIYCVWYPSGGFGHFINAILTLHGNNFVRPKKSLEFSANGNSHSLDLVVPKYLQECWPGGFEFRDDKNYCVLIDNGINNESTQFTSTFSNSTIIKICYTDRTWPVVARTMIDKAMESSIEEQLPTDVWNTDAAWARREKYFLFLRDHKLRHAWRSKEHCAIYIDELYNDYDEFFNTLNSIVQINQCGDLWKEWRTANAQYFNPIKAAKSVLNDVKLQWSSNLTHITDVWTQAVIYYYIWLEFGIEVPHNDFADFFTNTDQIIGLIR